MIEWYSIKDKIPDTDDEILLLTTEYEILSGHYIELDNEWIFYNDIDIDEITHWAHLNFPKD